MEVEEEEAPPSENESKECPVFADAGEPWVLFVNTDLDLDVWVKMMTLMSVYM